MLPQPREGKRLPVPQADVVRLLAGPFPLPLIEAVGQDQAVPLAECLPEGRLGLGVDELAANARIVGSHQDEIPSKQVGLPAGGRRGLEDDGNLVLGSDVVARQ